MFSLLNLKQHMRRYELNPPHLIIVAKLLCESRHIEM